MKKIEFYTARYCGKCRAIKRRLIELKEELKDIDIIFHDIDIERAKARKEKIDGVPTLIFYLSGREIDRMSGTILTEDILNLIKKERS
ncbi:MAG: thioredoxin family protein [Candidatus Izemoplasmatales bacterium]